MNIPRYEFDVVIVGAGGAGMRASLQLAKTGLKTALLSKVFPTRSHTVSAQGGIAATLGNVHPDDWLWHMYDTVKGSDYLGDQDAIEYMCRMGPEVIYELEHMGMPFSRLENGKIYQRAFGGQTQNFGEAPAIRTCAVADRTGHALLHTLYQKNLEAKTHFMSEWYALDLVKARDGGFAGITAICLETGEVVFFNAKAVVFATGGAGQIFQSTTNALTNTGDGLGIISRAGLPLEDMEMWQFHPTGIAGAGVLVTEGCRGEGAYLINKNGERFMERYAPHAKDLASRDVVSRAMAIELREGRGFDPNHIDFLKLKLDHLGEDIIKTRLPGIRELALTFAHVDPVTTPIPVVPTCHYMMGGIPTNRYGQVISVAEDGSEGIVDSLYAVGECACVSVHGANRLGSNSLLDLVVFGRAAGLHAEEAIKDGLPLRDASQSDIEASLQRYLRWENNKKGENPAVIKAEMQKVMQNDFGVFRIEESMQAGIKKLQELRERLQYASLTDHSKVFNTSRIEALELDNLMTVAFASAFSARARQESRGAHSREDYPKRDDKNWLKHTLYLNKDIIGYRAVHLKPLTVKTFEPKERVY